MKLKNRPDKTALLDRSKKTKLALTEVNFSALLVMGDENVPAYRRWHPIDFLTHKHHTECEVSLLLLLLAFLLWDK